MPKVSTQGPPSKLMMNEEIKKNKKRQLKINDCSALTAHKLGVGSGAEASCVTFGLDPLCCAITFAASDASQLVLTLT